MINEVTKYSKTALELFEGPQMWNAGVSHTDHSTHEKLHVVSAACTSVYLPRTVASRAIRIYIPFSAWRK